jgi:AraC-like DNA-binding protein
MSLPLFRHSRRIITEPDDFDDAVTGIDLKVDFQKRQESVSRVEQFQSESWALDFGEANVRTRVRGVLRDGWGSFCLNLGPADAIWNGQHSPTGALSLLPPFEEVDGRASAGFSWLTVAVPPDVWNRCLALAGREDPPDMLRVLQIPDAAFKHLRERFHICRRDLESAAAHPALARLASDRTAALVSVAFTTACEQECRIRMAHGSLHNRARLARRAEVWMREHLDQTLQIPDLCIALRVSRRELEYAFRATFDVSPREHLETLRMNAIRRALLRGGDKRLIDIAHAHGVTHLGRFAASYRALFGEPPSKTRKG